MQWTLFLVYFQCASLVLGKSISERTKKSQSFKYTIEELLTSTFPKKTSNDLDLDPCKAGKLKKCFCSETVRLLFAKPYHNGVLIGMGNNLLGSTFTKTVPFRINFNTSSLMTWPCQCNPFRRYAGLSD